MYTASRRKSKKTFYTTDFNEVIDLYYSNEGIATYDIPQTLKKKVEVYQQALKSFVQSSVNPLVKKIEEDILLNDKLLSKIIVIHVWQDNEKIISSVNGRIKSYVPRFTKRPPVKISIKRVFDWGVRYWLKQMGFFYNPFTKKMWRIVILKA